MHDIAGLVALATVGLWIAYLVPHRLRYRQQLLESRTEDRFSDALRVLVVTEPQGRRRQVAEARSECGPDSPKRSGLLSPARGLPVPVVPGGVTERRGGVVERPYGTQDKISADAARRVAQQRAQRAAALARRAAAARRRAVLTVGLLALTAVGWLVVALTPVAVVAGIVPTVLLAGVLGLGRRAVVQAQAADAAWERRQRQPQPGAVGSAPHGTRITGRALHPSDSHTEAIAQVASGTRTGGVVPAPGDRKAAELIEAATTGATPSAEVAPVVIEAGPADAEPADAEPADAEPADAEPADAEPAAPVEGAVEDAGDATAEGWSPVPVPRPTYTTKATAPRREPLPLVVDDVAAAPAPASADGAVEGEQSDTEAATPPALDLDAILARRRAVGE